MYKASLPFLKSDECERVKGQLSDIAKDMKEDRQQSQSRGSIYKLRTNLGSVSTRPTTALHNERKLVTTKSILLGIARTRTLVL